MHRMGAQAAKVGDFSQITAALREAAPLLERLWPQRITMLGQLEADKVAAAAWEVIAHIKVSTSQTQIVAGSKMLHHLLPDLIPPIDRRYTFRFFTGQMMVASDRAAFLSWFPQLADIGSRCGSRSGMPSGAKASWPPERRRSSTTPSWVTCNSGASETADRTQPYRCRLFPPSVRLASAQSAV